MKTTTKWELVSLFGHALRFLAIISFVCWLGVIIRDKGLKSMLLPLWEGQQVEAPK